MGKGRRFSLVSTVQNSWCVSTIRHTLAIFRRNTLKRKTVSKSTLHIKIFYFDQFNTKPPQPLNQSTNTFIFNRPVPISYHAELRRLHLRTHSKHNIKRNTRECIIPIFSRATTFWHEIMACWPRARSAARPARPSIIGAPPSSSGPRLSDKSAVLQTLGPFWPTRFPNYTSPAALSACFATDVRPRKFRGRIDRLSGIYQARA